MIDQKSKPERSNAPPSADFVSELLMGMRLVGLQYRRIQMAPPFGLRFGDAEGRAQFHFVANGPVLLRGPGDSVHTMNAGDAVLLPRGGLHDLVSQPDVAGQTISNFDVAPLCRDVSSVTACPAGTCRSSDAVVFSGCMEFDLGSMHPLVALMPEIMRVDTLLDRYPEILPMLEAMEREAKNSRAGSAGILSRLTDVVSASIVRGWVECGCTDATGWVDALHDPRLGRALAALHRDPSRDWTVASLAAEMGSSRSVFAERFLAVTGVTPVRYLTEVRMRLAAQWIGRDRLAIEVAAHRLGYGSTAAFSRAFKRVFGYPPGKSRQQ